MGARALPGWIRLVLFDLAGTTVTDGGSRGSLIGESLLQALRERGHQIDPAAITAQRGKSKRDAIRLLLPDTLSGAREGEADAIHQRFLTLLGNRAHEFAEIPGASETFRFLKDRAIHVGVGSGLPPTLVEEIVCRLRWVERGLVDYVGSAQAVGAGRPDPAMIHDAMARFGVTNPGEVLKVGDTVVDVWEGKNACAWTVAVVSGTQAAVALREAGPDFMISSVADLPRLFGCRDAAPWRMGRCHE